ncbi:MAG: ATP-binding protein [Spirochaetales bacterium]|nr:ATP-binding protein [Spirochaetales bacterium]
MKGSFDFKNLTISSQLFLAFIIVISFSVFTVTIIFSRNSFQTVKENSLSSFSLNNRQITSNLNDTLGTIDNYYNFVLSNRVIYNGLQQESFGTDPESYEAVVLFKDLLFSFISITDGMESAFYISRKGVVVSYLSGTVQPEFIGSGQFLDLPFIDKLILEPTREIWYLTGEKEDSIFYVRSIINPRNREVMGFLCFVIHKDIFASQIHKLTGGKSDFYVCDDRGNIIISTTEGRKVLSPKLIKKIKENLLQPPWRYNDKYYFAEVTSNSWYVFSELAVSDLIDMRKIILLGIFAFFLSVFPALFISGFFSRRYSRDFSNLIKSMRESEEGHIVRMTNWGSNVEARTMASQYYDMMENIKELTADLRQEIADKNRTERERQKLESQLRQSQKMEAVGQLAGGVAHDFNNLLTALFGYVDLGKISTEKDLGTDHEVYYQLTEIERLAQRAASLTRQLLTFSRKDVVQLKQLNLNRVILDMAKMLGRLVKENIELKMDLGDKLSLIKADEGHMEQVLMNLVVNAVHAMPDGGSIIIETANTWVSEDYAKFHADATSGPHVTLSISDTGCGMDKEVMEKIFEPFFTTKFREKGTGLGLATVHGIVTQSEGHISVYSEVGVGTTFRLFFPALTDSTEESREEPGGEAPIKRGSETILFCEDNDSVRQLVDNTLKSAGYHMLTYEDGRKALDGARGCPEKIDMLVTDVITPGLNGRELSAELNRDFPDLPVLYISGYTSNVIARHGVLEPGVNLLEKPFSRQKLLVTIREILDR